MNPRRIRVLVVDDSALVRKAISDCLATDPDIEVVGTAMDPVIARDKILKLNPDVLTLDIEMPRMDGISFLKILMKHRPIPVIILSSLTTAGSIKALEALQAGAVEVLAKSNGSYSSYDNRLKLIEKIKGAAQARLKPGSSQPLPEFTGLDAAIPATACPPPSQPPVAQKAAFIPPPKPAIQPITGAIAGAGRRYSSRQIILIGASTGGTEAIKNVLVNLPADLPGICIVQHIPAHFSTAFANRLNDLCQFEVREAKSGDPVRPGRALVAPGGHHMLVRWTGQGYAVDLNDGPPVHHQRPAVDVLFDSALEVGAGAYSLAILLPGMGRDGAQGMLKLRKAGAQTIAQNEETCVVFGMPREAIRLGGAQQVLGLHQISHRIDQYANEVSLIRNTGSR